MLYAERRQGTTTSAGSTTTAIDSGLVNMQPDFFRGKFLLCESGTQSGLFRPITDFTPSTGTITVAPAFTGAVATSVTYSIFTFNPALFTLAANEAIRKLNPTVCRFEQDYLIVESGRTVYEVPRGMDRVRWVGQASGQKVRDKFDRADSTTSIGGGWTATSGTWGISSERGYSVTDADGDLITQDIDAQDGYIECIVRGDMTAADYRVPTLVFRLVEDYTGAIPAASARDYLVVELRNALVDLRKVDAGTESSITTAVVTSSDGTDYRLGVLFQGTRIRVFLDYVEVLTHELIGPNYKFLAGKRAGIRWDVSGAPTVAARFDDYRAYAIPSAGYVEHHDWQQSPDGRELFFGNLGRSTGLGTERILRVEGTAPLTALADDTTYGTIASDTTAVLEIATTDASWGLLVEAVRAECYRAYQEPAWNLNSDTIPVYAQLEAQSRARVEQMIRGGQGMRIPQRALQYAY